MDHNLISKNKLIMVALYSFAENFRKEVTTELIDIWFDGLKTLSCEQIEEGTRRCLRECEFLPPIATFIEKAMQGRKIALLKESGEQPQIEHTSEAVPMPDEFKKLYKKFNRFENLSLIHI